MSKVSLHPICIKNQYENNNILGWDTSELRFGSVQNLFLELETLSLTEPFRMHWQADTPAYAPTRQTPPGRQTPPADGYCSGWYASYWNAFLFGIIFYFAKNCMKMKIGLKEGVRLSHPIDLPATAFPKYF